jgi:hypothetical protein
MSEKSMEFWVNHEQLLGALQLPLDAKIVGVESSEYSVVFHVEHPSFTPGEAKTSHCQVRDVWFFNWGLGRWIK